MFVSSVSPTRRWQSDQIVWKIDKNIHQIPVPDSVHVSIGPTLDPLIVHVTTFHVMTRQNPRPIRKRSVLERNRGPVKRVMEGIKVDPGFEVLQALDRIGYGIGRLWWIEKWWWGVERGGVVAVGWRFRPDDEEKQRVGFLVNCVEKVADGYKDLAVNIVAKKMRNI